MTIRIVNSDGVGYHTKVYDAFTGEDLTEDMDVGTIQVELSPEKAVTAIMNVWTPKIDITVEEAEMKQVCPHCGRAVDAKER